MKIRSWAGALALAAFAAAPVAHAQQKYDIDPVHSSVAFKVKHMMVSDVKGRFESFSGAIMLDPDKIGNSSVEVTIETASISTNNERRDNHLRSADFLDAENHPAITFKSKKIVKKGGQWAAVGDLTIRGVTKEVELPFTLNGPVVAGDASYIGASTTIEINRQDFGVSWSKTLDAGGVVASDKVRIEIDVEAKKQTS